MLIIQVMRDYQNEINYKYYNLVNSMIKAKLLSALKTLIDINHINISITK